MSEMDNICIKKIWEDDGLLELFVVAQSKFVKVNQTCYISAIDLKKKSESIKRYIQSGLQTYVEFGKIEGNYSPAFALELYPFDDYGHLNIEIDMEIVDNKSRAHRCKFFINTELGMLESFGEKLYSIYEAEIGSCACLFDE